MESTKRFTLRQVIALSLTGLVCGLGLLFYLVLDGSAKSILHSAERYREFASLEVENDVTAYLSKAPAAVRAFERQLDYGLIDPASPDSIQKGLLSLLLADPNISEATLTYGQSAGFDQNGAIVVNPASAGQVEILRASMPERYLETRTWNDGGRFLSQSKVFQPGATNAATSPSAVPAEDPTKHLTFQTTASRQFYGQLIAADLHWSQIDENLPESSRRVEVSVQKAVTDSDGKFVGVLRVGLTKDSIDQAVRLRLTAPGETDPHLIFLCDNQGRLITGLGNGAHITTSGNDLRIAPADVPRVASQALAQPVLHSVAADQPLAATSFSLGGVTYLCTFRYLKGTQDWIVGIVVPQNFYLGKLVNMRLQVLGALLILIMLIVLAGTFISQSVVRAHSLILRETLKMKQLDFAPSRNSSYLRDVEEVLGGLEKAKTAMRAMSKYVPVNLVRHLYQAGEEPVLGGQSMEISVLFTDIRDFTAVAEDMTADTLAKVLGHYLQVMADCLQAEQGIIDKYIGDAVMTLWNAPDRLPHHEVHACRAALACQAALHALYQSETWGGAPKFETNFGLHRCVASVGNFGAPDRLNYTAMGDGINLASRLEGLNKVYGTRIIVSEAIHAATKDHFQYRLLDRVAVKGKLQAVTIYELLSESKRASPPRSILAYEEAFALYQRRDFRAAAKILAFQLDDAPSRLLAQRCSDWLGKPPPDDWSPVHRWDTK